MVMEMTGQFRFVKHDTGRSHGFANRNLQPGSLTIVDLSCPCVTAEGACALFNMCLSIFLEQKTKSGRVVALDEAHRVNSSPDTFYFIVSSI
jgi:hypothetical protein